MLILRRPWTEQPQDAVEVDWENPINPGLIFADLPASNGVINAVGNARGVLSALDFSSVPTAYGRSLDCAATGLLQIDDGTNPLYDLSGELTLMALITPDNASGGAAGQYVMGSGNSAASQGQGAIRIKDKIGVYYGGAVIVEGATTLTSGTTYLVGFSRSGATGTRTVTVYLNGQSDGSTTSATSPGAQQVLALGSFGAAIGFGLPFDGRIHAARVFKRALSGSEWQKCYQNIWQIFAPRQIWIPATAAASFNPTLSLPTYVPGSLTSSAFRPRVTATWS
jgi:hypothetical protein